jgi:alkylated DNA nucleotide flippase Atl1
MWKSLFKELPANNQIVWIRVLNQYGELAQAKWKNSSQKFIVVLTGVEIPAYQVSRWKSL